MRTRENTIKNLCQKVFILSGIIALTAMQSAQATVIINDVTAIRSGDSRTDLFSVSNVLNGVNGEDLANSGDVNDPAAWSYSGGDNNWGRNENWNSPDGVDDQWIAFDLGSIQDGLKMNVANFDTSNAQNIDRGINQGDIYYRSDSFGGNSDLNGSAFDPTGWTLWGSAGSQTFTQTPAGGGFHDFQLIDLGVSARYIAIDINSSHGAASVGLNEVQFFSTAIPEPSSYAFLAGLLALTWISLRRRR